MFSCTRRPPNQPKTHRPRAWFPPHLPPLVRFSFSPVIPAMSINAVPTKPPIMDHDKSSNGFIQLPLGFVSPVECGLSKTASQSCWGITNLQAARCSPLGDLGLYRLLTLGGQRLESLQNVVAPPGERIGLRRLEDGTGTHGSYRRFRPGRRA